MSLLQKFKTDSYCVGGENYSGTNKRREFNAAKGTKLLQGNYTKRKRNKSRTISEAKIEAERLKDFFKSVKKATVNWKKSC